MGLYWVSGHAELRGNEIADELVRGGSGLGFLDLSRPWGSLGETYKMSPHVGSLTNTGLDGEVLEIPKDRLKN